MVSVSGFRGRVGDPLTPELVAALAAAFGAFLRSEGSGDTVHLGRDSRTSGAMFADAARAGLRSVGCGVVDLGVVATPTLLLAAEEAGSAGALGVTASHNPAEWNALKFAGGDGLFLDASRMSRFQAFLASTEPARAPWDGLGGARSDDEATARHLDRILGLPHVDVEGLRGRGFHVAVDCVHGAGGVVIPRLLEHLGCRVSGIGLDPDGRFPRDPEPTAANLGALAETVRSSGAELGFAVDPDVDRLSLVDGRGEPVGEDLTLALCADVVLGRETGPVVTNLSTSQVVEDVARAHGVPCFRAPVGEVNVARRMEAEGAVVGGEGNGGIILPALHLTRDAPLGVALILQHLLERGEALEEAVSRWPSYRIVKEKATFPREEISRAYRDLERTLGAGEGSDGAPAEVDTSDGLRLAWPGRREWLHVRPSGTEPVVRFIAEAPDLSRARALVTEARAILGA
jgi:phosphomannomutase